MSNALDRLKNPNNMMPEVSDYTPEEQMQSSAEDDAQFIFGMSQEAQQNFYQSVQEVTLDDEPDETEDVEEPEEAVVAEKPKENDGLFNNKKQRRPYTKKSQDVSGEWDPLLNQISRDIIKDLIENGYTVGNFDKTTTKKILNYMYKKF